METEFYCDYDPIKYMHDMSPELWKNWLLIKPDENTEYNCGANDDEGPVESKGFTLLMKLTILAIKYTEVEDILIEYIKNNPSEINVKNEKGFTALMFAIIHRYSNNNVVEILITAKNPETGRPLIDISIQNEYGSTALMFASQIGNESIIKMLIDTGLNYGNLDDTINLQNKWEINCI